jgi:hypothetical protein
VATDLVGGRRDDRGMTALPKLSATEKHDVLVGRGWRCRLDGKWLSPHPEDARFAFTFDAAWHDHTQREQDQRS